MNKSDMTLVFHPAEWISETVQMVIEMGYRVTPVYPGGSTKPFAKGQTYTDLSDYKDAVHIGVVLDNAVLLDYDGNKDGPIMELAELAIKLGIDSLPSPAQENKAGDSLHYLFKRPAGVDASTIKASADAYFPNIDIKTGNQLMHLKPHKILNDGGLPSLTELPEAPLALMTALRSNPVVEGQLAGARWSGSPEELAEARHILEFIDANCGYDDWMKVLMGIHSKFGDTQEAFNLADDWSKTGSRKYSGGVDVADKLRSFTQSNGNSVNWASVCHTAAEAGANLSNISMAFKVPSSGAQLFDFDTPAINLKTGQEALAKKDTHILAPKNLPTDILSSPVKARPRLYGNTVRRGKVTVLGGAGGVGKSMAQLMITVLLAIGRDLCGRAGKYALQQRRVLLINNEDDAEEVELRFRAIIKWCQLSAAEVDLMRSNIHYQSGYHQQLKLAYTGPDKIVRATQLKQEIINYCLQQKIDVLMVDPLVSLHDVNENDNGMMNAVMSEIKAVASYAGVGIMLLHHTKKLSGEKIDTDESLRGASSVKDAARQLYDRAEVNGSPQQVMDKLVNRPSSVLQIEAESLPPTSPSQPQIAAKPSFDIISIAPMRSEIEVVAGKNVWLFLADANYPGWSATVNGQDSALYSAQVLGKAVYLPAGKSFVVISYTPWSFYLGLAISVFSAALILGILFIKGRPRLLRV